jgi:hypothetical protein
MTLIFRFVNFLGLVVYLLVLQSCQPIVSEGMLNEQGSYPDQIIIVDAIQLSSEAGSTHAPFTIRLVDRLNNPVPQANISFLTTSGSAYASSMKTNLNGEVDVTWNFGTQVGLQQLRIFAELNGHITNKIVSVFLTQSIPSAAQSTITGTGPVPAEGKSQSTITITIRNSSGVGISGFYPTFSATDTGSTNIYGLCTQTNAGGVSLCTLRSKAAELKTLQLETPVVKTGGTASFTSVTPIISLEYTTIPVAGTTDDELTTQPVVTGYIAPGQVDFSNDTTVINITSYDGVDCTGSEIADSLDGDTAILMNNGVATFTNVKPLKTTIKSLMASTETLSTCENVTVLPGAPANIAIQSGDDQEEEVTSTLDPFVALITDANDNPVPGATVNWSIESGTGTLSTASSLSGATGLASSTLTYDTTAEIFSVKATLVANAESILFSAEALAAQPDTLTIEGGNLQQASVGSPLPVQLSVKVRDQYSNPVPDTAINWVNLSGGGSLGAAQSATGTNGVATVSYTLGTIAGLNEITATVDGYGLLTQTFEATGITGAASLITIVSGDGQTANYGTAIADPMEIEVTDEFFNPVNNAAIIWSTTVGALTASDLTTNASGIATSGLTFNNVAGTLRSVTATLDTATVDPSVTFNHTATVPAPTNLAGVDGTGDVDLTWDAVADAGSYKIYTSSDQGGPYTEAATSPTNSFDNLSITGITYIVVRALQGTIESADSNEISTPNLASWLTQIGLTNSGSPTDITLSALGDETCLKSVRTFDAVYCAGYTTGSLGEMNGGGKDGIIIKYDIPTGARLWIRQLGAITKHQNGNNSGDEECTSVAVSNDGSVYCAGHTTGSMSEANGGGKDAFVAKIANDGSLSWLVQLGQTTGNGFSKTNSSGDDSCNGVVEFDLDPDLMAESMHVFCGGGTKSTVAGDEDAFILKITQSGGYVWVKQIDEISGANTLANPNHIPMVSNYSNDESCSDLKASDTEIFCGGSTNGNLGTSVKGTPEFDVFSFALNPDPSGESITWLHQIYSDTGDEYCYGLHYESNTQQLFCGGKTNSDFAEINAGLIPGSTDVILVSFDNNPSHIGPMPGTPDTYGKEMWSRQLGAATATSLAPPIPERYQGNDSCLSVTSDGGRIFCGGETEGYMFDTNDGFGTDAFIASFAIGGHLINDFSKQFTSTSGNESCSAIEFIPDLNPADPGNVLCLGSTTGDLDGINEAAVPSMDIFKIVYDITATPTLDSPVLEEIDTISDPPISLNRAALDDACKALIEDSSGNLYCAGHTYGNLGEPNAGGADAFIMKLDKNGGLQWIRQLGEETLSDAMINGDGSGNDFCTSIALDSDENVYCAGYTSGNLKEDNAGKNDIFFAKYSPAGFLLSLKHFGDNSLGAYDGSGDDKCHALTINDNDDIYCAGETYALIDSNAGGSDAMVMKTDSSGDILWIHQIGSTNDLTAAGATTPNKTTDDVLYSIELDSTGNIYAAGGTKGSLFSDNLNSFKDAIILKLDTDGIRLWGKQFGDTGDEECFGLTIDSNQSVGYCGGYTTSGLNGGLNGDEDAFVKSFNLTAVFVQPEWINQFGTFMAEQCNDLSLDSSGNIYCGGETSGGFLIENNGGGKDSFIAKINQAGATIDFFQMGQTKMGVNDSQENQYCNSIKVTDSGSIICAGSTFGSTSDDNNGNGSNGNTSDILIFKLNSSGSL